jgi:hypothetical protein
MGVAIELPQVALSNVLAGAGCSMHRDAVDKALIEEVRSFGVQGKIVHAETTHGHE